MSLNCAVPSSRTRYRNHKYCRIDGGISGEIREEMIEDFMAPESDKSTPAYNMILRGTSLIRKRPPP